MISFYLPPRIVLAGGLGLIAAGSFSVKSVTEWPTKFSLIRTGLLAKEECVTVLGDCL